MARRKALDQSEKVLLSIRGSTMTKVRLLLGADPRYADPRQPGLPKRGVLSDIANELFSEWLKQEMLRAHKKEINATSYEQGVQ